MSSEIPVVDFAGYGEDNSKLADDLVAAFTNVGFVCIINHGITKEQTDSVFGLSTKFFDLPVSVKNKYKYPTEENTPVFGYVGPDDEVFFSDRPKDIKEVFDLWEAVDSENWPSDEEVPGFYSHLMSFISQLRELSNRIHHLIGVGLKLEDECYYKNLCEKGDLRPRLLNYPTITSKSKLKPGQLRCSEHTDYGSITLLFQDDCGGLQIMNKDGAYVDAVPIKGACLVNIGDFLAMSSGGVLKSTLHRVVITDENFMKRRLSIVCFCDPNGDAEIESNEAGGKITFTQWRNKRFRETGIIKY